VGLLPLTQLSQGARSSDHPVALAEVPGQGLQVLTWSRFTQAAAWAADRARREGGRRWLLACPDAWDFATGLAGLLLAGRTVVLPANFQPATVAALARKADGTLEAGGSLPGAALPGPVPGGRVEFWTAGSTGEPKGMPRSLAQLEAEVEALERLFGRGLPDGPVVGTVPHHHIYGCLFRILWPLAAGRPFQCEPAGDPACFRRALAHPRPVVLVASPAHLSRLPSLVDLDEIPVLPGAVFSSGGPLDAADALAWRRRVPGGVVEIYGSTETGGIAWRAQDGTPGSAEWTPFDDVVLAFGADGLVVSSFRAGPEPVRLEDWAEPAAGGRFRLLGRLDRTLKLEEKRISLPELEQALEAVPWVARAAVVPLPGPRPLLGAAVVPGPGAPAEPAARIRALREHLARRFDGPALPRRWRFLRELPYDERGKLTVQALADLFQPAPAREPRP
jgi:acyl-coenzyme A synthetase/AMP-(fatty) acid ligase